MSHTGEIQKKKFQLRICHTNGPEVQLVIIVGILPFPSLPSSPFSFFPPCLPLSLPSSLACLFLPSLPESLAESSHTCLQIPGVLFLGRVTMDTVIKLFQSYNTFHISKMRSSGLPLRGMHRTPAEGCEGNQKCHAQTCLFDIQIILS